MGSVLDIGAGDGAVLSELERRGLGNELHAIEISGSGIERIKQRNLKSLKTVQSFDGYTLPFPRQFLRHGVVDFTCSSMSSMNGYF